MVEVLLTQVLDLALDIVQVLMFEIQEDVVLVIIVANELFVLWLYNPLSAVDLVWMM